MGMEQPVSRPVDVGAWWAQEPPVAVITASGDLDDAAAVQLLRWCEARLHQGDLGVGRVGHLIVDISRVRRANVSALAILDHARTEAHRRQVGAHLVGAEALMGAVSLPARQRLGRWHRYPTLDGARAALGNACAAPVGSRAVDPDAITIRR